MTAATRPSKTASAALLCLALAACSGNGGGSSTGGSGSTGQTTAANGSGSSGGSASGSSGGASNCGTASIDFGSGSGGGGAGADFVSARFDTSGEIGSGIALADGGVAVLLGTSEDSACAALHLTTPAGSNSGTAVLLTLDPTATAPGVYAIEPDGGGHAVARYMFTISDGQGNGTGGTAPGNSGSITIDAFDGGSIAGSFDVTFESSGAAQPAHVTGQFESSGCGVCLQ